MRIISSFHDYYDVVQKEYEYVSDDCIYIRERSVEKPKYFIPVPVECVQASRHDTLWLRFCILGFCGKIIPVFNLRGVTREPLWFYDPNECIEIFNKVKKSSYKSSKCEFEYHYRQIYKFNEEINLNKDKYKELFLVKKSPIFFIEKRKEIIWNMKLLSIEFFRVMDTYSTFQEISMFMNNLSKSEKPIPKIDDKTMVEIKGFDKYSFRKDKMK